MGLFGKKKTPEEILAEGRTQFESGDMKHMFLTLHGLANKGDPEACYYIGFYWLKEKSDKHMAEKYLTIAAKGGQTDAAKLLAERLGVRDFLTQASESAPARQPTPAPAPAPAPAPKAKKGEGLCDEDGGADEEKNLRWYEKAAEQGDAEGMMEKSMRRGSTMKDYLKYYTVQSGDKELFCVDFYTDHPKIEEIGDNVNGGLGLSPWDWLRFFHVYLKKYAPELLKNSLVEIYEIDTFSDDSEDNEGVCLWGLLTDEYGFPEPGQAENAEKLVKMIRSLMENEEEIYRIMGEIEDE